MKEILREWNLGDLYILVPSRQTRHIRCCIATDYLLCRYHRLRLAPERQHIVTQYFEIRYGTLSYKRSCFFGRNDFFFYWHVYNVSRKLVRQGKGDRSIKQICSVVETKDLGARDYFFPNKFRL